MRNVAGLSVLFLLFFASLPRTVVGASQQAETMDKVPFPASRDSQKIVIGQVEEVTLVPWGINLPARIDTGATISALDARDVSVRNNLADFKLGNEYGGSRLRLPVVDWVDIRSSVGTEKRPVVEIGICLGPKLMRALAALSNRSQMAYPFLVGRNVLNGRFLVDTSRSKAARPACSSSSL